MSQSLKPITNISYKETTPNVVPVILLHGLSSTKESWDECAHIIAHRIGAKVYSFDARNHGDSEWVDDIGYDSMAEDLRSFMDNMSIEKAVLIGHSMGGKTAMVFAFKYPERIQCLIIEDISLTPSSNRNIVQTYMEKLKEIPAAIPSHLDLSGAKQFVADLITEKQAKTERRKLWDGSDIPLRKKHDGEGFEWKMNLEVLTQFIRHGAPRQYFSSSDVYTGPVLVIYGTKSPFNVMDDSDVFLKHFPNASHVPIEGGGHSLHKDFPDSFCDLVCYFILEEKFSHEASKAH